MAAHPKMSPPHARFWKQAAKIIASFGTFGFVMAAAADNDDLGGYRGGGGRLVSQLVELTLLARPDDGRSRFEWEEAKGAQADLHTHLEAWGLRLRSCDPLLRAPTTG